MRLLLIRHGQTEWNAAHRAQGHADIPLDEVGQQQAQAVADHLANREIHEVWSSDLLRAMQTAEPVARSAGATLRTVELLRERSFGEWEGLHFREIGANIDAASVAQGVHKADVRPPGGESIRDVWNRLSTLPELIAKTQKPVAIVSHGGTLSLVLAKLIGGSLVTARAFSFHNASVTELHRLPEGSWRLHRLSDIAHLDRIHTLGGNLDGVHR
jgi:broad specificity phosphatase PhoE